MNFIWAHGPSVCNAQWYFTAKLLIHACTSDKVSPKWLNFCFNTAVFRSFGLFEARAEVEFFPKTGCHKFSIEECEYAFGDQIEGQF